MCGIVGILGRAPVAEQLVDSLKRLEYRGYDSAGVATLEGGASTRRRAEGKLQESGSAAAGANRSPATPASATPAGPPTARRPRTTRIRTRPTRVAVVHNGIIENFRELRDELRGKGTVFKTETDTEVVAHLVDDHARARASIAGRSRARRRCRSCAAPSRSASSSQGEDDLMIGARKGSPLAVGYGDGEMYLGSDAIALGAVHRHASAISKTATGWC